MDQDYLVKRILTLMLFLLPVVASATTLSIVLSEPGSGAPVGDVLVPGETVRVTIAYQTPANGGQEVGLRLLAFNVLFDNTELQFVGDPMMLAPAPGFLSTDIGMPQPGRLEFLADCSLEGGVCAPVSPLGPDPVFSFDVQAVGSGPSLIAFEVIANSTPSAALEGGAPDPVTPIHRTLTIGQPDLAGGQCDVDPDHTLLGETTLHYVINNNGDAATGTFDVAVVLSDDDVIGNGDDTPVTTFAITDIPAGGMASGSLELSLDIDVIFPRALADDAVGAGGGVSTSRDFVGLVIDVNADVAESDETNNSDQGKGVDSDDFTFFPWDMNPADGDVTPTDAVFVINRIGESTTVENASADVNGDGAVTATDAIHVINRLGYVINGEVEDLDDAGLDSLRSDK